MSIIDVALYDLFSKHINTTGSKFETSEFWLEDWREEILINPKYWVSVLGMLHHHWCVIQKRNKEYEIILINQHDKIFDRKNFTKTLECYNFINENKFERWGPGFPETAFIPYPDTQPHSSYP